MGVGQLKSASLALLMLLSILVVPFASASSGAVGVVVGPATESEHLVIAGDQVNFSIDLEEVSGGLANVTVTYGLVTLEGSELSRNTTTLLSLASTSTTTLNLSIPNVPYGFSTMFVELSGDVALNTSTHVNAFSRTVHRLRPLSVGLGSTNSVLSTGLNMNGTLTGNQSIHEGDRLRLEVPIINSGDVNWTGAMNVSVVQGSTVHHLNRTNLTVVSMTSLVVVNEFADAMVEGGLNWTVELVGDIGADESQRSRNGTVAVLPPPLPMLNGFFAPFDESTAVAGQAVNLSYTVFNNGTAAFNGHLRCNDGTEDVHSTNVSLGSGENISIQFEVNARPVTIVCTEEGQRTAASSSWPASVRLNVSSASFVIAGAPSPSLEGGPWHQGDVITANLLIRNTGSLEGRLRLELVDIAEVSVGDWVTLPSGSAGEVRVTHAFSTAGDRSLGWRLVSDDGGFTGSSNGSFPVSVLSSQSVALSLTLLNGSINSVVVSATTTLDDGPAREVRIRAGVDRGSGPVYLYDQIRLLEPGQQTHVFDFGGAEGERAVVRLSPVGWSIGPGALSATRSLPDALTSYRMTMNPVLSPIRPVVGDEVTLNVLVEQSGAFQDSSSTLRLLDAYGQELVNTTVTGWSTSGAMTESMVFVWPAGNNVLIRAHWDVNGEVISAQTSYLSSAPQEEQEATIPWGSLLWGSVLGGVLIAVMRVAVRRPSSESSKTVTTASSTPATAPVSNEEKREVTCPACDRSLRVPRSYSGSVGCPDCSHKFGVEPEETVSSNDQSGLEEEKTTVFCPACDQSLRVPSSYAGSVRCPACTKVFKAGQGTDPEED